MKKLVVVERVGFSFYMDNRLDTSMARVGKSVNVKDKDRLFVVDGSEGSGKSVFAMQLACRLDSSFCLKRVCFTPESFKKAILSASKGEAVVFDEAFTGLSSRTALSKINNLLVSLMMEMRQKNLFVFIVLPTIFLLDKYVALWRSVGLFHVYTKKGKRGRWIYFNRAKKKALYLYGKKDYTYKNKHIPKSGFRGRFLNQYVVDEVEYRFFKKKALEDKSFFDSDDNSKYLLQRNKLLKCLREEFGLSIRKVSVLISKYDVQLARNSVSEAIKNVDDSKF